MSHSPLALTTLGFLAPSTGGERVPVAGLYADIAGNELTASLEVRKIATSVKSRTPIKAAAEIGNLMIKVENGTS